jgi:hypothetical protein
MREKLGIHEDIKDESGNVKNVVKHHNFICFLGHWCLYKE